MARTITYLLWPRAYAPLGLTTLACDAALAAQAPPFAVPTIASIPVEFALFACVLAGVALHRCAGRF